MHVKINYPLNSILQLAHYMLIMFISYELIVSCAPLKKEAPKQPNILFAIADDASFPHMGAYGTNWIKTPAFDRVAREGLLFMNAYTPNAKCAPSRACILTGRNSWALKEAFPKIPWAVFRTSVDE